MPFYPSQEDKGFDLFKQIASNMPMIFYVIDKNWIFEISYGKGLKKLGLEPNQVVGLSARRYTRAMMASFRASGRPWKEITYTKNT